jgi:hypothetical protein
MSNDTYDCEWCDEATPIEKLRFCKACGQELCNFCFTRHVGDLNPHTGKRCHGEGHPPDRETPKEQYDDHDDSHNPLGYYTT